MRRRHYALNITFLLSTVLLTTISVAQERYFPLNHRQPTGIAGRWSVLTHPQKHDYMQPVKIQLPSDGEVTFFRADNQVVTQAPAQVSMMVGHSYRVRISGMPEFPGVELFPTIEVLDRLHPPQGQAENFAIPVEITEDEVRIVMQDRMVTKVVYLEQPNIAAPFDQGERIRVEDLPVTENLLEAADERGRPMAIVRIGGRVPDLRTEAATLYSHAPLAGLPEK